MVTKKTGLSLPSCCYDCHDKDSPYLPLTEGKLNNGWKIKVCCDIKEILVARDYATFGD